LLNTKTQQRGAINPLWLIALLIIISIAFIVYKMEISQTSATNNETSPETETVKTKSELEYYKLSTAAISPDKFSSASLAYTINTIDKYEITVTDDVIYELNVAHFKTESNDEKRAIVFIPSDLNEKGKPVVGSDKSSQYRYEKWLTAAEAIKEYTPEESLFVSFWDNAQRIELFTGRNVWTSLPEKEAYSSEQEQLLWQSVAGSFDTEGKSKKYAEYLLMDVGSAIAKLKEQLPENIAHYLLVTSDDLAHVQELAILKGESLPLETRIFPANADMHNSISNVKDWAKDGDGTGSYLVQPVSEQSIRVWRITDKSFEDSLLIRALPFTSSLDKPFENFKLVYQSDWGSYLSIFELR
jgi:hydroxylamine oxidation protein HaoB